MTYKEGVFINDNHMKIETKHKTFDAQCDLITRGNVIGHSQMSCSITSFEETERNGFTWDKGYLQNYDINWLFQDAPEYIKTEVRNLLKERSGILYKFRHFSVYKQEVIHGYVLTTSSYEDAKIIRKWYTGPTWKSYYVIDECIKYISNGEE
jgi:hypothetical protein